MSNKTWDILVIGVTGYTGQFVLDYLKTYKLSLGLKIGFGGRSLERTETLVKDNSNWEPVYVDVTDESSVVAAVKQTRVVMSLAGPWWAHGATVVRACARYGVHYVDVTGETHWVAKIIDEYDYLAHKTGACIVPCAGYDSIPSDLAVYLSTKTLEKHLSKPVLANVKSTCAVRWKINGLSGGSRATIMSRYEQVPAEKRTDGAGWGLSPIPGPSGFSASPRILYSLPHVQPTVYGGFFVMGPVNEPVVRRSWGLRERQRREEAVKSGVSPFPASKFSYQEFMATPTAYRGIMLSLRLFLGGIALALFPLARWALKRALPKNGEGPPKDKAVEGWFELTNITEAEGVVAKTVIKGDGDPSYYLTAWMVVECAILLLDPSNLTPLGREGGILTASTAFGDSLAPALNATGKIETNSAVFVQEETKKTR